MGSDFHCPPCRFTETLASKIERVVVDGVDRSPPIDASAKAWGDPDVPSATGAIVDLGDPAAAAAHLAQIESKHLRVAEALRATQARNRLLLTGVEDYAIFTLDPVGRVVTWNSNAEGHQGVQRRSDHRSQLFVFLSPRRSYERAGQPRCSGSPRNTAVTRNTACECAGTARDFWGALTFTALHDAAGNLSGFTEFSHDLSEHDVAGVRYRAVLEAALDAMLVVTRGGEIILVNVKAERQFGYCRDELLGRKVNCIIPEGFAERLIADGLQSADEALARPIGPENELTGRRKDGTEFPMELRLSPLDTVDGNPGHGGNPRHQRAKGGRQASCTDRGQIPRTAGGGSGRDGGSEPLRRDRPAECSSGETVRVPPRRTDWAESQQHHSRGLRGTADRGRSSFGGRRVGAADRRRDRINRPAEGRQRIPDRDHVEPLRVRTKEFL